MKIPRAIAILLWPLSLIYGVAARLRAWLYARSWLAQRRLNRPVISVGNLTVGGTGKTPMVIWLAERFLAEGKRVGILSRGYRGDGATSDEIELMKQRLGVRVAFGIGKDRYNQGRKLEAAGVDVFLLDDGFQHLPLLRDVDILLIDGSREFKGEMMLPAGSLREPITALERADMIIYTRVDTSFSMTAVVEKIRSTQKYPVYTCQTDLVGFRQGRGSYDLRTRDEIGNGPFFAFCGIGNPDAFFRDLARWRLPIAGKMTFRDHHRYSIDDCSRLKNAALKAGARGLVTTEKDLQNIPGERALTMPLFACAIDIDVRSGDELMAAIHRKIESSRGAAA
jgi:tetraacyldisaccharide 4'-kinase